MITITEKDGATIIVIEKPSGSEQKVIEQAKKVQQALSSNVWSKFACNRNKSNTSQTTTTSNSNSLQIEGFDVEETILPDDIPF